MSATRTVEERRLRREESRQLEARIATVLRAGVLSAAVLLTVSMPWIVFQDRSHRAHHLSVGEALRLIDTGTELRTPAAW